MLEQYIHGAKGGLGKAGKPQVDLLTRMRLSNDKLNDLYERKSSLEI